MQFLKLIFPKRFHSLLNKELFYLLMFSIALKIFLMTFSIHPDFFFIHLFPNLLVSHGVFNIYQLFASELSEMSGFYYSPPVFYFFSTLQILFRPLLPGFDIYMDNAFEIYKSGMAAPLAYLNSAKINYYYPFLLLKLPYILFDFGVLITVLRLVDSKLNARRAFLFWIFNPVVLYGTYAYGQFDIIPTFILIFGLYLGLKKRFILAMLTIGFAATFKNFSLLAILPAALTFGKNFNQRIAFFFIGLIPFSISYFIVLLQAPSQAAYTLIPRFYLEKTILGSTTYSDFSKFSRLTSMVITYIVILLLSLFAKISQKEKIIGLVAISLISLFAFSPVILFHYLTIVTPFLILCFVGSKYFSSLFTLYIVSAAVFKLWTPIQQLGLFAPINNAFLFMPSSSEVISKVFPYTYISSFFYVVFFILSIYFISKIAFKLIFQTEIR